MNDVSHEEAVAELLGEREAIRATLQRMSGRVGGLAFLARVWAVNLQTRQTLH